MVGPPLLSRLLAAIARGASTPPIRKVSAAAVRSRPRKGIRIVFAIILISPYVWPASARLVNLRKAEFLLRAVEYDGYFGARVRHSQCNLVSRLQRDDAACQRGGHVRTRRRRNQAGVCHVG